MATGSADTAFSPLVPEEFVDAGLGTRSFVYALYDDSAVEAGPAAFPGQRAGTTTE